jgi:hypothetical protein
MPLDDSHGRSQDLVSSSHQHEDPKVEASLLGQLGQHTHVWRVKHLVRPTVVCCRYPEATGGIREEVT